MYKIVLYKSGKIAGECDYSDREDFIVAMNFWVRRANPVSCTPSMMMFEIEE